MRTSKLLTRGLLLLSAVGVTITVAAIAHTGAQEPGRVALATARPASAAANTLGLRITDDPQARDMVIEVGPVDLPASGGHRQLPAFHGTIPMDGWIQGFRVEMVDGQGRAVPRRTLHHVNVIAPGHRELFSPIMQRLAAAGQETAPVSLPRMLGLRVRRGQELIVTAMMHNPTGQDLRGVRLRAHFTYTPGNTLLRPISAFPFYMDVMPPASLHSYDLPAGRSSKSWEGRPAVNGRILAVSGHLHKYGTALRLEDVTARRVIWQAAPELAADGEVANVPQGFMVARLGVPVERDHVYRLTVEYNNTSGEMIPGGGMGALGGIFVPDAADAWPAVDRNNPEMKLDWHLVHTGNQNGHGGHHGGAAPAMMPGMDHGSMPMDHGSMSGMDHGAMPATGHDHGATSAASTTTAAKPAAAPAAAGHTHMPGMEHGHR